jgi:hypothetical protein
VAIESNSPITVQGKTFTYNQWWMTGMWQEALDPNGPVRMTANFCRLSRDTETGVGSLYTADGVPVNYRVTLPDLFGTDPADPAIEMAVQGVFQTIFGMTPNENVTRVNMVLFVAAVVAQIARIKGVID